MTGIYLRDVVSYIILISIFLTGFPFQLSVDFYWYYPVYMLFLVVSTIVYHKVNLKFLLLLLTLVVYCLLTYDYGLSLVIKQLVNIVFSAMVFYNFVVHERFNLEAIFKKYLAISKLVLVVGLLQVAMFHLGIGHVFVQTFPWLGFANINVRLQSFAQEPSFIALTFAPVVFLSLYNIFNPNRQLISLKWSVLFVLGYLLTLSSLAYLSVLLMLVLLYFSRFTVSKLLTVLFAVVGICLIGYLAYRHIENIRVRVDDTVFGLTNNIFQNENFKKIHLSTYAILTNLEVAKQSLGKNPITGNGLGTHELTYRGKLPTEVLEYRVLNAEDASGLAIRLTTETGLLGLIAFLFFTIRYKISLSSVVNRSHLSLWIFNQGIFVFIILCLLRNGNYTLHGKVLFLILYYYTYRAIKVKWKRPAAHFSAEM